MRVIGTFFIVKLFVFLMILTGFSVISQAGSFTCAICKNEFDDAYKYKQGASITEAESTCMECCNTKNVVTDEVLSSRCSEMSLDQKTTDDTANPDNKDLSMEECADIIASLGGQKRNVAIQRVALAFGSKGKRKDEEKEILRNKDIDNQKICNWIISRSNDADEITQNKIRKIASAHTAQKDQKHQKKLST